jgi:hypothetical protein
MIWKNANLTKLFEDGQTIRREYLRDVTSFLLTQNEVSETVYNRSVSKSVLVHALTCLSQANSTFDRKLAMRFRLIASRLHGLLGQSTRLCQ